MDNYISGLVSIVIPTYKRSDMLTRAIESVLNQTYKDIECLVVNDNIAGDEYSQLLYEIVKPYTSDSRFKVVEQPKHINGAAARNAGIRQAKGEYIGFLDDDDFYDSRKIERQVEVLKTLDASYGAVSCLMKLYHDGKLTYATVPYSCDNLHFKVLAHSVSLGTGTVLIRRECLDKAGYWDENLRRFQDLQLFAFLTKKYKVKLIPEHLHNRENKDAQNRPTIDKYESLKSAYIQSVSKLIEDFGWLRRNAIMKMYDFEAAPLYVRNGMKVKGYLKMIKVVLNPISFSHALLVLKRRLLGKRMKNQIAH